MPRSVIDKWASRAGLVLLGLLAGVLVTLLGFVPAPRVERVEVAAPADPALLVGGGEYVETPDGSRPIFGWAEDAEAVQAVEAAEGIIPFGQTPAGRAVRGDDADTFLWRAVRQAAGKSPTEDWYPNIDQGPVGSCVGAGYKHGSDVVTAVQIVAGTPAAWKPTSAEVVYAGSRVEVGGGRIRGDGSVGAWAAAWLSRYGVLPMEVVGRHDLSRYDPARARSWGRSGVPDDLEPEARKFPVKGVAKCASFGECKRAIQQGYPVVVCSDQGFTMARDGNGFCRPSGSWAHCMLFCAYRKSPEGVFTLNSWGDRAHTGPRWPADMPVAGFWADPRTVDRMLRANDSYALSDATGFPARDVPAFFTRAEPKLNRFRDDVFALAW